jgi:hypothetical protein
MGNGFEERKATFSLFKKLWTKKYPSSRFNHLSTASASIGPSNIGILKFICTLKEAAPPFEEDASPVGSCERFAGNYPSSHSSIA